MVVLTVVNEKKIVAGCLVFVEVDDAHEGCESLLFHLLIIDVLSAFDISPAGGFLPGLIDVDIAFGASAKRRRGALGTTHHPEQDCRYLIQEVDDQNQG